MKVLVSIAGVVALQSAGLLKMQVCNRTRVASAMHKVCRLVKVSHAIRDRAMRLYRLKFAPKCPRLRTRMLPDVGIVARGNPRWLRCVCEASGHSVRTGKAQDLFRGHNVTSVDKLVIAVEPYEESLADRLLRYDVAASDLLYTSLAVAMMPAPRVRIVVAAAPSDQAMRAVSDFVGSPVKRDASALHFCAGHAWSTLRGAYAVSSDVHDLVKDVDDYYKRFDDRIHQCDESRAIAIPGCTYVVDGIVAHGGKTLSGSKQALMDITLRSVVPKRGNFSFYLDLRATGVRVKHAAKLDGKAAPVFTIARKGGSVVAAPSALVPSPYFLAPAWWGNYTREMRTLSRRRSWADRKRKVLFRGSCGPGAAERLKLLDLARHEKRFDFKFVGFIGNYSSLQHCVSSVAPGANLSHFADRKLSLGGYSEYRYLLHMPGAATGSYSRNLQHLFMHGSIILVWQSSALEWYYPLLRDRVHYLAVNASTITAVLDDVERNATLRNVLLAGADYVATRLLSEDFISARWAALFDPLRRRQRHARLQLPATACTCADSATLMRCGFCHHADLLTRILHPGARKKGAWI